jgi:hypothetical protein
MAGMRTCRVSERRSDRVYERTLGTVRTEGYVKLNHLEWTRRSVVNDVDGPETCESCLVSHQPRSQAIINLS